MSTRSLFIMFVVCVACSVTSFLIGRAERADATPSAWEQAGLAVDGGATVAAAAILAVPIVAG